ncbi:hypothetical protein [Bacillus sp. Marseille-P3661]|uniref:hypothetical protein n=1 Tax=Bacillus sp. Marseille-P3661 TaxID=1936234 RepID=UPI000C85B7A2|nr:hypothetical protein [Bacillus sp. Marseille-P3661]
MYKKLVIKHETIFPLEDALNTSITIGHSLNTHIQLKVFEEKGNRTIKEAEFNHPIFYNGETIEVEFNINDHGIISFSALHPETNESVDFMLDKLFLLDDQEVRTIKETLRYT